MEVPRGSMSWPLLGVLLLSSAAPALAQQRSAVPNPAEHIVSAVDVALTHRLIEANGTQSVPIATEVAFTLQKLRTLSGTTKIRLTYKTPGPNDRTQGRHPLEGARVEYSPMRSPPRCSTKRAIGPIHGCRSLRRPGWGRSTHGSTRSCSGPPTPPPGARRWNWRMDVRLDGLDASPATSGPAEICPRSCWSTPRRVCR